jgi:hypothetical protein
VNRLLPCLLGIAVLMTAGTATAMPRIAVARVARVSRHAARVCGLASKRGHGKKRRHGKKRLTRKCRARSKTHGARPSAAPRPIASSSPPSLSSPPVTASDWAAPVPAGSQSPPLPVTLPSAWDAPALSNPTTIELSATNYVLALSQSRDYILQCPAGELALPAALNVWGGHDVVMENCDFNVASADWAGHFSDQSGTLWVQGVHFGGSQLTGGIQLQEPGATVVLRDVVFDTVHGSQSTNHAELIQTWAGPARLMIDGLAGSTTYQGLFLTPNQQYTGPPPAVFDLRHIDIDDTQGAYALWLGDVSGSPAGDARGAIATWNVQDVYVNPNPARTWPGWWLWPQPSTGDPTWNTVSAGAPPGGSYVQASSDGATGVDQDAEPSALLGEQP